MNILNLIIIPWFISSLNAADCPFETGKYGEGASFQNIACRTFIKDARQTKDSSRNITFTDEGLIQVFSNFPGTTNSNSTGARVYYLFPKRTKQQIISHNETELTFKHPSGAVFVFDKTGNPSSKDLVMKVSKEINSQNKSGIEIESYPAGLVVDLGYRVGNTPVLNKNATVTITDKNKKKCQITNNQFNKINRDTAELIYKSNESLHKFLSVTCPQLDISDLLKPIAEDLKSITKTSRLGQHPTIEKPSLEVDSKRMPKPQTDQLGELINQLENGTRTK